MIDLINIYNRLTNNDRSALRDIYTYKVQLQQIALDLLDAYKSNKRTPQWDSILDVYMKLCNAIYNNFDSMTIIDDGIYDMLMEIYKSVFPDTYQIGAIPVNIDFTGSIEPDEVPDGTYCPFMTIDFDKGESIDQWLFADNLLVPTHVDPRFFDMSVDRTKYPINEKTTLTVPHKYPKLVGTLDKCKFTLIREAVEAGVEDDPTIKIFERDFLGKHLQMGIIDYNHIELLLELKMDGMSVEADVNNKIISARSRGDTGLDLADDLTTVFKDYEFPNCPEMDESFGMKFECIITKTNLERLAALKGRPYKNARNGVIGLIKSLDAYAFRDLVTLVPLETSLDVDPITEVKFMNQYYTKDVSLPYAYVSGDYNSVLYQVYRFVKEAEKCKPIMNYLYDGIVVHYIDPNIRAILGRQNSVNQYSVAIKFNPMKKKTVFRGYTFTVGQDGRITPMAHYDPVEFLGTIHTKSSCHSYGRFKELRLGVGDIIEVTYVNDVMPYVTRPYSDDYTEEFSRETTPEQFPTHCPCCGTPLAFFNGGAGDSAICPNLNCEGRRIARLANMMDKLNFKGFGEATIVKLGILSFTELMTIDGNIVIEKLGEKNGMKFINMREQFRNTPIPDYRIIGALGFTSVATETWKKILRQIPIDALISRPTQDVYLELVGIKGIGKVTAEVVSNELPAFYRDIDTIRKLPKLQFTYATRQITIRWTGCRDQELEDALTNLGYDANSKSGVTKATDLLIVPYTGYSSTKMNKIGPNTIIVAVDEFKKNMNYYLGLIK